jgi:hypothetical protein
MVDLSKNNKPIMTATLLTRNEKVAALKNRIISIREKLPANWRAIVFQKYPKYNTNLGVNLLNNVIALRSTNEEVTAILEDIVALSNNVS